jgi:hypothetical protein
MNLTFSPSAPQIFAAADNDKVFKLGVSIGDVYRALQTLLGGHYVNQFNRFGRVWKVFVEAEPQYHWIKKSTPPAWPIPGIAGGRKAKALASANALSLRFTDATTAPHCSAGVIRWSKGFSWQK